MLRCTCAAVMSTGYVLRIILHSARGSWRQKQHSTARRCLSCGGRQLLHPSQCRSRICGWIACGVCGVCGVAGTQAQCVKLCTQAMHLRLWVAWSVCVEWLIESA